MATISKKTQRLLEAQAQRARAAEQRRLAQESAEVDRLIADTGMAICVAQSDDPRSPGPYFAYTIGRSLKGQPELCAFGRQRAELAPLLEVVAGVLELNKTIKIPEHGEVLTLPGVGQWSIVRVPPEVFNMLEHAQARYTFLRAVRLVRIG